MAELIPIRRRMGKSPIVGYWLYDQGDSIELDAARAKGSMRMSIRLPKDKSDLLVVVGALLKAAGMDLTGEVMLAQSRKEV